MAVTTDESFYHQFENTFHRLSKNGKAPWLQEGKIERYIAFDPLSGVVFTGINSIMLDMAAAEKGYKSSCWLSAKEIKDNNLRIKYKEQPTIIAYINKYTSPVDVHPVTGKAFDNENPKEKYLFVYNLEQVRGIEPEEIKRIKEIENYRIRRQINTLVHNTKEKNYKKISQELLHKAAVKAPDNTAIPIAVVLSQYRLAQEVKAHYNCPINKTDFLKSLGNQKKTNIIRALYNTEVLKDRLFSPDGNLEHGTIRTVKRTLQHQQKHQMQL